ncbi:MAG: sigma-E factor negative regulatory protein [Pseudomonadota bacterium]
MTSHDLRPDDRESLSALFDGEVHGEARLFALRRLSHDAAWQGQCGRWQLIGDAMRRQAPLAAPSGFAARVATAVAAQAASVAVQAPAPARAASRGRMRWIGGGALAASVALALVVTSLQTAREPRGRTGAVVASSPVATPAAGPAAPAVAIEPPAVAIPAAPGVEAAAARDQAPVRRLVATAPRRERPAAVPRADSGRAATASVAEAALLATPAGNPFNLAAGEALTARPWPRATLGSTTAAFTTRYGAAGDSAGERPSFYPFEPRPQGEPEQVPSP